MEIVLHHYEKFVARIDFSSAKEKIEQIKLQQCEKRVKEQKMRLKRKRILKGVLTASLSAALLAGVFHIPKEMETKNISSKVKNHIPSPKTEEIEMLEEATSIEILDSIAQIEENPVDNNNEQSKLPIIDTISEQSYLQALDWNNEEDVISFAGRMYHMTKEQVKEAIRNHPDIVESQINQNVGIVRAAAQDYWYQTNLEIDRNPTVSHLTSKEREELILKIADLYEITDPEVRKTIIAIYRLESGHGNSTLCINKNNLGGIRGNDGTFIAYPTQEAGADGLIRTIMNLMERAKRNENYSEEKTVAENISIYYCTELQDEKGNNSSADVVWAEKVNGMVEAISIEQKEIPKMA